MTAPKYTCKRETSLTLNIDAGDGEQCIATIREWPKGGSIHVQSGWGNYAYSWFAIGEGSFTDFLSRLNFGYAMGKFLGSRDYMVADLPEFFHLQREVLIESRKRRYIDSDMAREIWDALESVESEAGDELDVFRLMDEEQFIGGVSRSLVNALHGPGSYAHDLTMPTKEDPQCRGFWDNHWPCIIAELQKIEAEKLAQRISDEAPSDGVTRCACHPGEYCKPAPAAQRHGGGQ